MIASSAVDFKKDRFVRLHKVLWDGIETPEYDFDEPDGTSYTDFVRQNSEVFRAFDHVETKTEWESLKRKKKSKHHETSANLTEFEKCERVVIRTTRFDRDRSIITELKELYSHRCQLCGKPLNTPLLPNSVTHGHHIRPLGQPHNGPDVRGNVLIVCPNTTRNCNMEAWRSKEILWQ